MREVDGTVELVLKKNCIRISITFRNFGKLSVDQEASIFTLYIRCIYRFISGGDSRKVFQTFMPIVSRTISDRHVCMVLGIHRWLIRNRNGGKGIRGSYAGSSGADKARAPHLRVVAREAKGFVLGISSYTSRREIRTHIPKKCRRISGLVL